MMMMINLMTEGQHFPEPRGDRKRRHGLPHLRDPRLPELLFELSQLQVLGRSLDGACLDKNELRESIDKK